MINPNLIKLTPKTLKFSQIRTISQQLLNPKTKIKAPKPKCRITSKERFQLAKQKWMFSLSNDGSNNSEKESNDALKWVIGVDADYNGALALLKYDHSKIISAEVFDSPLVKAPFGNKLRKRLDVRSIVQLVQSFGAPTGTVAYLDQSIPLITGRGPTIKSCWNGGFTNGLWTGVLVASGFSVVPVRSLVWKRELELAGGRKNKGQSRALATQLFPSLSSMFKRERDHGRAEALLIAAYGNGHKIRTNMGVELDKKVAKLQKNKEKEVVKLHLQ